MAIAEDSKRPVAERLAALDEINRRAFDLRGFAEYRADYTRVLKDLRTDPSAKVRDAAFKRLALSLDDESRQLLEDGITGAGEPLVSRKTAITLLGLDDHAASRQLLRQVAEHGDAGEKVAALHGLAADPEAADLLERVASDTSEPTSARQAAAMSLKVASPERFAEVAKALVVNDDDDQVRAVAMSALAHNAEVRDLADDEQFSEDLRGVSKLTRSRTLKTFIKKFNDRSN